MAKKLYVGNLAYSTTESQIRNLFTQAGEVDTVSLIMDRETGRAKGFGFVVMTTEEGANQAIRLFNNYSLDSRTLTVNEARPREERSGGGYGRRDGGSSYGNNHRNNRY